MEYIMDIQQLVSDLFREIYSHGYTDSDIVDEINTDVKKECVDIIQKYKKTDTMAIHITIALVERNYIQSKEDEIECLGFVKGFLFCKLGFLYFDRQPWNPSL